MKKPILRMMKGLPASGKSTYAKELESQGWVRANKDDIRKAYFPNWTHKDEREVLEMEDAEIVAGLLAGHNVVVDDTNFNPKHQERLEGIAKEFGADFEVLFIDTPLEVCIKRNEQRANKVPLNVITDMHKKYIEPLRGVKPPVYNDDFEECIIVDVDGTLAHIDPSNPRSPYDGSRAHEDLLDDAVSNIVNMAYGHGYKVIVLTGRGEEHQQLTRDWLDAKGVNYDELYSRGINEQDRRPDTEVKKELYETHVKNRFNVKYVIDDRPTVCRMWRSLGLKTLQVGDPHVEF